MPARRMKRAPRRRPKRAPRKAKRSGKKSGLSVTSQYAHIVETIPVTNMYSDTPYQATFNLAQFFRATTIAKNFQFYRAKKVKWEYMPLYNTFQQNNAGPAVAKPQMYMIMNRDQDPYWSTRTPADALFSIQSSGVDPRAFIKNTEIIYTPNWCSPGLSAYTVNTSNASVGSVVSLGLKKQFGWLPTPNLDAYARPDRSNLTANPVGAFGYTTAPTLNAAVNYNGHNIYIAQENDPEVPIASIVCTVEWEFKLGKENYSTVVRDVPDVSGVVPE